MRDTDSNKFVAALAIIATPFALGAFMLAWSPAAQYGAQDPKHDGYVQPRSISDLVEKTAKSTVTIWCDVSKTVGGQGTAWAIELETAISDIYPTTLITNHHVIEDCIGGEGDVTIALPGQSERKAVIVEWDVENDLAVLASKSKYPALKLSESAPYSGYWVMAFGSADGYEGSIAEDDAGSFFIRNGSTVAFVDIGEWEHDGQNVGLIEVYALVAVGLKEVNKDLAVELTTDLSRRFGSWFFLKRDDGMWNLLFKADLIGATVDSAELINAIRLVAIVADEEDDKIVRKYGGSVFAPE